MNAHLVASGLLIAALALPGCERIFPPAETPEPETASPVVPGESVAELPVRPESAENGAAIDWDAARRDLAARSGENGEGAFQVAAGGDAPPVPVFLPSVAVDVQGGEAAIRFQPTSDGYYAFFPGAAYDTIVNGTNVVISEPGAAAPAPRTDAYVFQPTTTGAQVAFSRYGADYLVEFECKELVNGNPACITEDDAVAFARGLAISGTR